MNSNELVLFKMKDWFADKVANEIRHNICSADVFAVLKETEKAIYGMISISANRSKCVWIPKSCLEKIEGSIDFHTRFGMDFETAQEEFHLFWSSYC